MEAAKEKVQSGHITFAVRNSTVEGIDIHEGDFLGIREGRVIASSSDFMSVGRQLLDEMIGNDSEVLTMLSGGNVSEQQIEQLTTYVRHSYPDLDLDVHDGGQPLDYFIFAVE